jgi:G6PDH family F420-dependent oxidoreductase
MSGGRFRLGLGAGENLNEHVVAKPWPPVHVRHEMLEEAIEIIRTLLGGGYHSHDGKYFTVYDARIFTLPDEPPPVYVAASGSASVSLAARAGDGMIATQPKSELVEAFDAATGGSKPKYGQLAVSIDDDEARARRVAWERFRFSAPGWKVQSELPNPVNFEAATAMVTEEQVAELVPCGPDPERHLEAIAEWTQAGFDHLALAPVGDPGRFFRGWERDLRPRLQEQRLAA